MTERNKLTEAYREALRLHKLSWLKRIEGKAKYFWQKDKFDDSHIPEKYKEEDNWDKVNRKLIAFTIYENYEDGKFNAILTLDEAIMLLTKLNYGNIHYYDEVDIDLENYMLGAEVYKIKVI